MPRISVVLPVYNGADHLHEAVSSVLKQTLDDFELIVVDDASTDNSAQILDKFNDSRIIRVKHPSNAGLPATLLAGIAHAQGEFIARQDQDDFSHPARFAKQVAAFDAKNSLGLVGTWAAIISQTHDRSWAQVGSHQHPAGNSILKWRMLWSNPFVHSSVMIRRSILDEVGSYDASPERALPEDFDLWSRISRISEVANIPEFLQSYRQSPSGMSQTLATQILEGVTRVASENLGIALELSANNSNVVGIVRALNHASNESAHRMQIFKWVVMLNQAARSIEGFPASAWAKEVAPTQLRMLRNALFG